MLQWGNQDYLLASHVLYIVVLVCHANQHRTPSLTRSNNSLEELELRLSLLSYSWSGGSTFCTSPPRRGVM